MSNDGQSSYSYKTLSGPLEDLLKITKNYPEFLGLKGISYLTFLLQVLTLTVYIYFAFFYIHNHYIFYFLLSMCIVQSLFMIADIMSMSDLFYSLRSKKLLRRNNSRILTIGILKILAGSPVSGAVEFLLWFTLARIWELNPLRVKFSDCYRAIANSSSIILISLLLIFTIYFPHSVYKSVYLFTLITIGIIGQIYIFRYRSNEKVNLTTTHYSFLIFSDFYLTTLFIIHFNIFHFYQNWITVLLAEFAVLCLFDFFITRLSIYHEEYSPNWNWSLRYVRLFLGVIVLLIGLYFLTSTYLVEMVISLLLFKTIIITYKTATDSIIFWYMGISILISFGYYLISYVTYVAYKGYHDSNIKNEMELDSSYQPVIHKVKEVIADYNAMKEYYSNLNVQKVLEAKTQLVKLQQHMDKIIVEEISKSKNKWFEEGYKKAQLELSEGIHLNSKENLERNVKIFDMLFKVDDAPKGKDERKEFYKKIYRKLTQIYHPDTDNKSDTNRIMQLINDHYENITK